MKNSLPLWIIAVSLTIILISIPVQQAFAAEPQFLTYLADDPDDADNFLSAGDTLTITFNEATNATGGGAISQAEINANFTDGAGAPDLGTTYTGVWSADSISLVITLTNPAGATLNIGATTIAGLAGSNIADANGGNDDTIDTTGDTAALSGDFGLRSTGGSDAIPPSFVTTFDANEYPISIGDTKFTFAELGFNNPTTTVEIGKPIQVNLLMYDDLGPTYISQVELYTNTRGTLSGVSNSDTSIIYKSGSPRIVLDPNGFFSDVNFTSSIVNQKLQLTFDITFAKEMEKSDIIVQARDTENGVGILTVSDAWQVIPAQAEETAETPTDESADDSVSGEIKVKTLNVEKSSYFMREEILFFGTVDGYKFGSIVSIMIRNPSNNFLTLISTFPDKDGYFEATMKTDSKFKTDGTYSATAFTDDPNKGTQAIFYFSREAPPPPPPPPVKTSPVQSIQTEPTTTAEPTTTTEPTIIAEPVTPKPKPRPSFVDPEKDPQSYVDRYNNEASYKEWFDGNFPDYTIYEAVGLAEPAKEKVPGWIKNNAKWWSEGQIDDGTFVSGIQFLMTKKIIDIPDLPEQASEKARPSFVDPEKDPQSYVDRYNNEASYKEWFDKNHPGFTIGEAVGLPEPIPGWIKNNAEWWSQGLITEDDFVKGIEFLVKNGIIRV